MVINALEKILNGTLFRYYLLELKKNQWKTLDELKHIQLQKLKAIITHAYRYVPYYHQLFNSAKIKPDDIKSQDDLKKIPVTTKLDLQRNYSNFIMKGIDITRQLSVFTSGSTGIPLKIVMNPRDAAYMWTSDVYPFLECGVSLRDKFASIYGGGESIITRGMHPVISGKFIETIIPVYNRQERIINALRQINPDVITTFPSVLLLLSNYDVSDINPRLIFTNGETLTQHCRNLVKSTFGLEVHNMYGSMEFDRLAFECDAHCGLHMITDYAFIEFVDENGESVDSGEPGELVITGLANRVMPLIRYKLGDIGIPSDEKCSCGRAWPLIKSIQGRTDDYITLPSGKRISLRYLAMPVYEEIIESNVFSISQYQIIQEKRHRIVFKVVKGKKFDSQILLRIKRNLEEFFTRENEDMEICMQLVDEIPTERTGKRRVLTSKIQ